MTLVSSVVVIIMTVWLRLMGIRYLNRVTIFLWQKLSLAVRFLSLIL